VLAAGGFGEGDCSGNFLSSLLAVQKFRFCASSAFRTGVMVCQKIRIFFESSFKASSALATLVAEQFSCLVGATALYDSVRAGNSFVANRIKQRAPSRQRNGSAT